MRLIDADNLKPTKGMFIYQTEEADVIATEAYRWELIEREAPTVKAIPIEWINDWLNKGRNAKYFIPMMKMVEQWEKENEQNKENTSQTD